MLKSFGYAAKPSSIRLKPMAFERDPAGPHDRNVEHGDVRFRYVIDMASLRQDMAAEAEAEATA
jgi:hypothetical protein